MTRDLQGGSKQQNRARLVCLLCDTQTPRATWLSLLVAGCLITTNGARLRGSVLQHYVFPGLRRCDVFRWARCKRGQGNHLCVCGVVQCRVLWVQTRGRMATQRVRLQSMSSSANRRGVSFLCPRLSRSCAHGRCSGHVHEAPNQPKC